MGTLIGTHIHQSHLFFSPHHLIDHAGITLDDLDHLVRNVLIHIIRHWNAVIAVSIHFHSSIHRLQVNALPIRLASVRE